MYFWGMILGFQVVWFACAWGASHHYPLLPIIVSLAYLNTYISKQVQKKQAYLFLLKMLALGFLLDSILGFSKLITFASAYPEPFAFLQPWWLSLLWLCFAASAKVSFSWLENRQYVAVLLGALTGPIAYYSGVQLGAILQIQALGYVLLSAGWAGTMFILIRFIRKQASHIQ
jgi:hypothetical protein